MKTFATIGRTAIDTDKVLAVRKIDSREDYTDEQWELMNESARRFETFLMIPLCACCEVYFKDVEKPLASHLRIFGSGIGRDRSD